MTMSVKKEKSYGQGRRGFLRQAAFAALALPLAASLLAVDCPFCRVRLTVPGDFSAGPQGRNGQVFTLNEGEEILATVSVGKLLGENYIQFKDLPGACDFFNPPGLKTEGPPRKRLIHGLTTFWVRGELVDPQKGSYWMVIVYFDGGTGICRVVGTVRSRDKRLEELLLRPILESLAPQV